MQLPYLLGVKKRFQWLLVNERLSRRQRIIPLLSHCLIYQSGLLLLLLCYWCLRWCSGMKINRKRSAQHPSKQISRWLRKYRFCNFWMLPCLVRSKQIINWYLKWIGHSMIPSLRELRSGQWESSILRDGCRRFSNLYRHIKLSVCMFVCDRMCLLPTNSVPKRSTHT